MGKKEWGGKKETESIVDAVSSCATYLGYSPDGGSERPDARANQMQSCVAEVSVEIGLPSFAAKAEKKDPP